MGELVPTFAPFTFHWYAGVVPPFTGVAVNVTSDPGQKGFDDAAIVTPAGRLEFTIMVMEFEVAGFPAVQFSDEVRIQVTISPPDGL